MGQNKQAALTMSNTHSLNAVFFVLLAISEGPEGLCSAWGTFTVFKLPELSSVAALLFTTEGQLTFHCLVTL